MNKWDVRNLQIVQNELEHALVKEQRYYSLKGNDMSLVWEAIDMVIRWKTREGDNVSQSNTVSPESTGKVSQSTKPSGFK